MMKPEYIDGDRDRTTNHRLSLLHFDDHLVAVDKPAGLLVHPGRESVDRVTCLSLLRSQLDRWVWPVHRLDRQTSGVLVMGLSKEAAAGMQESMLDGGVEKTYVAIVRGHLQERILVDRPLKRIDSPDHLDDARSEIIPIGTAEIDEPVGRYPTARYSLVAVRPQTGRRHQIRRHLAGLSHPILGDTRYGDGRHNRLVRRRFDLHRLALHALSLRFPHPDDGKTLVLTALVPHDLSRMLSALDWPDAPNDLIRIGNRSGDTDGFDRADGQ